jgi:hypothetical protein
MLSPSLLIMLPTHLCMDEVFLGSISKGSVHVNTYVLLLRPSKVSLAEVLVYNSVVS